MVFIVNEAHLAQLFFESQTVKVFAIVSTMSIQSV